MIAFNNKIIPTVPTSVEYQEGSRTTKEGNKKSEMINRVIRSALFWLVRNSFTFQRKNRFHCETTELDIVNLTPSIRWHFCRLQVVHLSKPKKHLANASEQFYQHSRPNALRNWSRSAVDTTPSWLMSAGQSSWQSLNAQAPLSHVAEPS